MGGMTITKIQNRHKTLVPVDVFSHYGPAPSVVLRYSVLSIGAKGLYAYLCTYINLNEAKKGDMKAWPSRRRMQRELGISNNTLSKYLNELQALGFIAVKQTRVLREGRRVFGNNVYTLQRYVDLPVGLGGNTPFLEGVEKHCDSHFGIHGFFESGCLHTSNTIYSNTKDTRYNHLSVLYPEHSMRFDESTSSPQTTTDMLKETGLSVDDLIAFWNEQGVNPHDRLGNRTKTRIEKALVQALEDFSAQELLGSISTYSKMYKERRCAHKYRLVEFLEKRGYEHFLHEENWKWRTPREKLTREDFTYTETSQDLSVFSFLWDDEPREDEHEQD